MTMKPTQRDINQFIGHRIRQMREYYRVSEEELSACLGVTQTQLYNYEIGQSYIPATQLHIAIKHFNVPANLFFEGMFQYSNMPYMGINNEVPRWIN